MTSRLVAFVLASLSSTAARADTWSLDPAHTRVGFRVSHMVVSSVEGHFSGVSGQLDYQPGKLDDLGLEVEVQLASVDTRNADRDTHLRSPDFFDAEAHPTMTFVSREVRKSRKGFDLIGDLTLRGVTRPVTLAASGLGQVVVDPWGNRRLGATATATIDRQDFGVSWNQALDAGGLVVGDDVEIRIDVEFVAPGQPQNG